MAKPKIVKAKVKNDAEADRRLREVLGKVKAKTTIDFVRDIRGK